MSPVRTLVDAVEHAPVVGGDRRPIGREASSAGRGRGARRCVRVGAVAALAVGLALVTGTAEVAASPARSAENGVFGWQGVGGAAGEVGAGRGVTVALVDTGVSDTPVLNRTSGRLVDGVDTSPLLHGESPRTTGRFVDGHGHGSFLASIIAGGRLGEHGRMVGVAPAARLVVVKVADEQGRTAPQAVIAGLDWVAAQRPRIPVAALALARPVGSDGCSADPLVAAVARLRAAGTMVFTAAGNGGAELASPACSDAAVAVGAADTSAGRPRAAAFTAGWHGSFRRPDLWAPGAHVLGVLPADTLIARTQPTSQRADGLWRGSGTSEATAVAAGARAASLTGAATSGGAEPPATPAAPPFSLQRNPAAIAPGQLARSSLLASASVRSGSRWSGNSWSGNSWSGNSWSGNSWSGNSWS